MNYKTYWLVTLVSVLLCSMATYLVSQEQGPERWEERISQFEEKDKESPPFDGSILFVGSSSIAMWKDIGKYFPNYQILNRGFGGSVFNDVIYYADRIIYPYKPSKVFVYEGDNDIASGDAPKKVLKNAKKLRKLISNNLGKEVPVIFISPKPSVARWNLKTQYEATNTLLKKYANKKPFTEFADVWAPALDKDGKVLEHIFLKDNLHMNADGYEIWKKVLLQYLEME